MGMRLGVACLVLGGALAAAPLLAQDEAEEEEEEAGFGTLVAELTPEAVEEGAGVAGASAVFRGELDAGSGDVCYILEARGLRDAGEAHIHRGLPGESGSAVIDLLVTGDDGDICIAKQPRDINGILNDAVGHYVDIHLRSNRRTVALRGQLAAE
ncbi:MAG TPA: CHRD domain-containing protein [Sphingomonadaceae bacterium]|nr:CHRD domain-containing protein [Sphingomonadaceae bacterium]